METSLSERYLGNLHTLYDLNNNTEWHMENTGNFLISAGEADNEKTIWF